MKWQSMGHIYSLEEMQSRYELHCVTLDAINFVVSKHVTSKKLSSKLALFLYQVVNINNNCLK